MIVKHSGSQTVFEAFTQRGERKAILNEIVVWCKETLDEDQFEYSNVIPTAKNVFRQTFWLHDRSAATLFKLRWAAK